MKFRSVVSSHYALVVSVLFGLASIEAIAQDNLEFVDPEDDVSRAINFDQAVTVEWMVGDDIPVRGPVSLETTHGKVSESVQITDDFGRATFIVSSDSPGNATLTARTVTDTIYMEVSFEEPPPGSDLLDLVPYQPPYGASSVMRTNENDRRYWLAKDRIAARIEPGLLVSELQDFIDNNFVIDRFFIGPSLLVLVFDGNKRPKPLRELARELEDLQFMRGADVFKPVRKAGLVARLDRSEQAYMVPDEIIVRFVAAPNAAEEDDFKDDYKLSDLIQFGTNPRRFLAKIDIDQQSKDTIRLAADMSRDGRVANADPNFSTVRRPRSAGAGEPGSSFQWYHRNDGDFGTEDADIDTDLAWHFTEGSSTTVIAIADSGFDIEHPDLRENLDVADMFDLADSDTSDLLADYLGFDAFAHGTHAAGVAGARGDNNRGYSGSCPQCRLLLIRHLHDPDHFQEILAINTAEAESADVLSISWGFEDKESAEEVWEAIKEAANADVTVVMAMTNEDVDNCDSTGDGDYIDTSANPFAIAVSGVSDYDERGASYGDAKGHGICMDVLAPTRGGAKAVHTTTVMMIDGKKVSSYWHDFSGTSAATPLVAGVVGLMKTLDGDLSPLEVQRILQDTADRVDPAHADYSADSGFSRPGGLPTHGYGRINAYEAVKLVATNEPVDVDVPRGNNKMDLFLRDNVTDWGNTERPSSTIFNSPREQYDSYRSVDIKIDVNTDGPSVVTPGDFRNFASESPEPGAGGTVYVRVRNRGPDSVPTATLKLHAAVVNGTLPLLPSDFWTDYPNDSTQTTAWQSIGETPLIDIPYSGASIAGCPRDPDVPACDPDGATVTDPANIVPFELPSTLDWDVDAGQRLVLLAVVHDDEHDPVQGKLTGNSAFNVVQIAVDYDNNVTLWDPSDNSGGGGGLGMLSLLGLLLVAGRRRF